jgi:transposase
MRGKNEQQVSMLTLRTPAQMVPPHHPIRRVKDIVEGVLRQLSPALEGMYSRIGRPSVPPERLLKAQLLIALYSVRSDRLFCEQLQYNMLFRWFLDMGLDEEPFDPSTFSQNRERLFKHDIGQQLLSTVVTHGRAKKLLSDEHFSVDGTLIEAWASLKSFRQKDAPTRQPPDDPGNPSVDFHGEKRTNETHESTTDPEAKLARKTYGTAAKLSFSAHAISENRNGLVVALTVAAATGRAEREQALKMLDGLAPSKRITLGADRGYNTRDFVAGCRERQVTAHVAQKKQFNAIDQRTTRHAGYAVSTRKRKRIEEIWGWMKTVAGFRRTRFRGIARTTLAAQLIASAYNLLRIAKLETA